MLQPILLSTVVGALAGIFPLLIGFLQAWLGNESSHVSPHRRPPMDSDRRIAVNLIFLGGAVGVLVGWSGANQGDDIAILAGITSIFVSSSYGAQYARRLNRFYLRRAQELLQSGDTRGAREDAQEVIRSSPRLRQNAKSILRLIDEIAVNRTVTDPMLMPMIDRRLE